MRTRNVQFTRTRKPQISIMSGAGQGGSTFAPGTGWLSADRLIFGSGRNLNGQGQTDFSPKEANGENNQRRIQKVIRIKNWEERYENAHSRKRTTLMWVPVPNSHDSLGYCTLMNMKGGVEIYGVWIVLLTLASKCPKRGELANEHGVPYSPQEISLKTRCPIKSINEALKTLEKIGWISTSANEVADDANEVADDANKGAPTATRIEGNRREEKGIYLKKRWEELYNEYPKKVCKQAAKTAIEKALGVKDFDYLMDAVKEFAESVVGADKQFVPYPATWFNRGCYEDDRSEWKKLGRVAATGTNIRMSGEALKSRRDELRSKEAIIKGGKLTYGPYRLSDGALKPQFAKELREVENQLKGLRDKQIKLT